MIVWRKQQSPGDSTEGRIQEHVGVAGGHIGAINSLDYDEDDLPQYAFLGPAAGDSWSISLQFSGVCRRTIS